MRFALYAVITIVASLQVAVAAGGKSQLLLGATPSRTIRLRFGVGMAPGPELYTAATAERH
jgi:hypothetical protein